MCIDISAPGPPRGTHQYNHSSNTQPAAPPNNPYAHIPYVPTVPGDRRDPPWEPERMYYPPQPQQPGEETSAETCIHT